MFNGFNNSNHCLFQDALAWVDICSLIAVWRPLSSPDAISWICSKPESMRPSIFELAVEIAKNCSYTKLCKLVPHKPTDDSENKVLFILNILLFLHVCCLTVSLLNLTVRLA